MPNGNGSGNEDKYDGIISKWAREYGLHPAFVKAIIKAESNFNPRAYRAEPGINDASYGLMQILFKTAKGIGYQGGPAGLFDPESNVRFGAKYLGMQLKDLGSEELATAAYNAGPEFVSRLAERHGDDFAKIFEHLPTVTRNYVPKVMSFYSEYKWWWGGAHKTP